MTDPERRRVLARLRQRRKRARDRERRLLALQGWPSAVPRRVSGVRAAGRSPLPAAPPTAPRPRLPVSADTGAASPERAFAHPWWAPIHPGASAGYQAPGARAFGVRAGAGLPPGPPARAAALRVAGRPPVRATVCAPSPHSGAGGAGDQMVGTVGRPPGRPAAGWDEVAHLARQGLVPAEVVARWERLYGPPPGWLRALLSGGVPPGAGRRA